MRFLSHLEGIVFFPFSMFFLVLLYKKDFLSCLNNKHYLCWWTLRNPNDKLKPPRSINDLEPKLKSEHCLFTLRSLH